MNSTALAASPSVDIYRRRGFGVVSRLARMEEAPGRHAADPQESERDPGEGDYVPRHRQEDLSSYLRPLMVG